ncbi:MAG: hypothetical protein GY853_14420 [PVC group bacterium]|nr:hypothetical protein [PVC group bacterium]
MKDKFFVDLQHDIQKIVDDNIDELTSNKREILFRAKQGDNWRYGHYHSFIHPGAGKHYHYITTPEGNNSVIMPETVGQCTGMRDKNGVKIFEGDIYHKGDPNIIYNVVWLDCGLIGKQIGSSSYAGVEYWKDDIEITGNIHDNPELLI